MYDITTTEGKGRMDRSKASAWLLNETLTTPKDIAFPP